MAFSYDDAKELHAQLQQRDERRHRELRALRRYWQGDYWATGDSGGDRSSVSSVTQLFLDLKGQQADTGPDLKLVHNILQEVCVKYQTFLAPVPMVKTFIDAPYSEPRRAQADRRQRAIYGTWAANRITVRMAEIAWYLPLMGDCFIGIWPDFDRKVPRLIIRSPETAHPVRSFDGTTLEQILFRWEMDERQIARQFPNYTPKADGQKGRYRLMRPKANAGGERKVEILEYCDTDQCALWADEQPLRQIQHGYGFNLFDQMGFIPVPGETFNHGAVEQIVSMVEMGNAGYSLVFQAMLENTFPTMVIENPAMAPEEIVRGPGSVIPVNQGGGVSYLTPPVQALPTQVMFLRENADRVLEASGMPRVNFGQSPTTSIATGSAINELQGAGSGSTVEMVQGTGIGPALVSWNEKCLTMYQTEFKADTVNLYGTERKTIQDSNAGKTFALTFKGSEIVGSTRNEVVFSPHMDEHEKLVEMLQAVGAGLVSKKHAREYALSISDNDQMVEEILGEQLEDGLLQALLASLQQDPSPANVDQIERQAASFIEQTPLVVSPAAVPHPLLTAGVGQTPVGGGAPATFPGGTGGLAAPPFQLPAGAPPPTGSTDAASAASSGAPGAPAAGTVTVQDAQTAFKQVQLTGRAWLVGQIAAAGQTTDPVDVALTVRGDETALQQAAPFPVAFHTVTGEPQEQAVEINPKQ